MLRVLDHRQTLQYLSSQGYRADIQQVAGGHRCVLRCGLERWEGRGPSTGSAIEAALRLIVPSKITRTLLAEAAEATSAARAKSA